MLRTAAAVSTASENGGVGRGRPCSCRDRGCGEVRAQFAKARMRAMNAAKLRRCQIAPARAGREFFSHRLEIKQQKIIFRRHLKMAAETPFATFTRDDSQR